MAAARGFWTCGLGIKPDEDSIGGTIPTNHDRKSLALKHNRVNLAQTLPVMESRKSMRRVHGTYQPTRPMLTWFLFWLLLATSFLESITWAQHSLWVKFSVHFGATSVENTFITVVYVIVVIFIFQLVSMQVRFHMHWSMGVTLAFVVLQAVLLLAWKGGSWRVQSVLLASYLVVQLVGLAAQAFAWRAFPALQRKLWWMSELELRGSEPPTPIPSMHGRMLPTMSGTQANCFFTYVGPFSRLLPQGLRQARTFHLGYWGEVDEKGRPHGYGEWIDSYYFGEDLRGLWEAGVPVGPFKSRESGSGSAFTSLRIGYVQNRKDRPDRASSMTPVPLSYGVMATECGTAGLFFREYPLVCCT